MSKKSLILSIPMLVLVVLLGGWLLVRRSAPVSGPSPVSPAPVAPSAPALPLLEPPTRGKDSVKDTSATKSPEMLRNEQIISILAQENSEPESGIRLSFEETGDHHVKGLATLESDPRKRISFFATDVLRYSDQQAGREPQYGTWTIIDRDSATCELMNEYSFSEKMTGKCIDGKKGGLRVSEIWRRVSGNPKEDCSNHVFEGRVVVRGWYEWRMNYVEREWMLVVDKSDESKLIIGLSRPPSFQLRNASPELEEALKNADPNKPVSLTIKKLGYYCEGSPWLEL